MTTPIRRSAAASADASAIPRNVANRIAHIDALRAFSVLLVVIMHAGLTIVPGDGGVTVFFCISGYIITSLLIREKEREGTFDIRGFYVRRFLKIAPPFAAIIILPTLAYGVVREVDLLALAGQVFFAYNWLEVRAGTEVEGLMPGTNVVWSLAVEEQFYIVFALFWLVTFPLRHWRLMTATVASVALICSLTVRSYLALDADDFHHMARGTDARMDAIALGVLLALLLSGSGELSRRWRQRLAHDAVLILAILIFLAGSILLRGYWGQWAPRPAFQALSAALIIAYGLTPSPGFIKRQFYRICEMRIVQTIGLASYSIYLSHYVIVRLLADPLLQDWPSLPRVTLTVVASLLPGIALYYVLEVPVVRARKRASRPSMGTKDGHVAPS